MRIMRLGRGGEGLKVNKMDEEEEVSAWKGLERGKGN